ncbi:orotidine-5'-phosphate decarboxylase [bacterium]|nr:orotidine-5'-phosphate decarboxylase [bacterium]
MNNKVNPSDRLIFALDFTDRNKAETFVNELDGLVNFFKVGIILHTSAGPDFVQWLLKKGKKVFLDLKFFDIKATVRDAVKQVSDMGVDFLTVHANREVMLGAVEGKGANPLKILAVTLLTNLGALDPLETRVGLKTEELVLHRAKMAAETGCDGVITSGKEIRAIKEKEGNKLLVVTPGVRPAGALQDEHQRITTPFDAIEAGADYLVVGRPIKNASEPRLVATKIISEIEAGLHKRV